MQPKTPSSDLTDVGEETLESVSATPDGLIVSSKFVMECFLPLSQAWIGL